MPGKPLLHIVDVFAENRYEGNQLAVFRHTAGLSDQEMQCIAREMNFSETTFVLSEEAQDGAFSVRIFTPQAEVPFAGHPTLGTAFVIQQEIIGSPIETVTLDLAVGKIPVDFTYDQNHPAYLWMTQKAPEFGPTFDVATFTEMLGLEPGDFDSAFPIQAVSTGLPTTIIPLNSRAAIRRIKLNLDAYERFVARDVPKLLLACCREPYDAANDLNVRMFTPYYGVMEDPATGSANGCLAGYLVKHRYLNGERIDVRVEQGYEIQRPSLLLLKATEDNGRIKVQVGGRVVPVAKGELV